MRRILIPLLVLAAALVFAAAASAASPPSIAAGYYTSCTVDSVGAVKCWGYNSYGELGRGTSAGDYALGEKGDSTKVQLGTGRSATRVGFYNDHGCAVLDTGAIKCWGLNDRGQLGYGDTANRGSTPSTVGDNLPTVDLGTGRTATDVVVLDDSTCALLDTGQVKCWGRGDQGQLGLGDTTNHGDAPGEMGDALPAVDLGTGRTAVALARSSATVCALLDNHQVKCWGENMSGKLGQGDSTHRGDAPGEMGDNLPAVALGAGRTATSIAVTTSGACAVLDTGALKCWGGSGLLGRGDYADRGDGPGEMGDALPAVNLGTGRTATAVTGGNAHACALLDDASVKCWGRDTYGETGNGDGTDRGLLPGEMGDNLHPVNLGAGRTAVSVVAGHMSTCVELDTGVVKCFGHRGALGVNAPNDYIGDAPGEVGDALPTLLVSRVTAATTSTSLHSCAVLDSGRLKCFGENGRGQLGLGDTSDRGAAPGEMGDALRLVDLGTGRTAVAVATGSAHTCALLDTGAVKCWGENGSGALGLGSTDGRGDDAGEMGDSLPAVDLGTGRTATAIAAGGDFTCALLDTGAVKCWGESSDGQLGLGDRGGRGGAPGEMGDDLSAVDLGSGRTATAITAGTTHACAVLDTGAVKCWGANTSGQLGLGDVDDRGDEPGEMGASLAAVSLGTGRTATAISAGQRHTCATLDTGAVKCWGENGYGQLGLGDTDTRGDGPGEMGDALPAVDVGGDIAHLATGWMHTCALLVTDEVKCWGQNGTGGILGIGATDHRGDGAGEMGASLPAVDLGTARTARTLAAGLGVTCAGLDDGSAKCWGWGAGQLGQGDTADRGATAATMGDNLPAIHLGTGFSPDGIAPTAAASPIAADLQRSVEVRLSAADVGRSGLRELRYVVGTSAGNPFGAGSAVYSGPIELADGERVSYAAVDRNGNRGRVVTTAAAQVDDVAPVTTDDVPSAGQTGPVTVTLTATDAKAGVDEIRYTTGTSPGDPAGGDVYDPHAKPVLAIGERIRYAATDAVGNVETAKTSRAVAAVPQPQPAAPAAQAVTPPAADPAPAPAATPRATIDAPSGSSGRLKITKGRFLTLPIRCSARPCTSVTKAKAVLRLPGAKKVWTVTATKLKLTAGKQVTVRFTLPKALRKARRAALRKNKRATVTVTVTLTTPKGTFMTVPMPLKLKG